MVSISYRFTILPLLFIKIKEGKAYTVSHRFESVASDASVQLLFNNPDTSGKTAYIVMIEVTSTGQGWVDIYRDNTVTASGTPLTPFNLNLGSTNTSSMTVEYGGTYTLGAQSLNTVCPGGSGVRAIGAATEVGETAEIPSGHNILIQFTNRSASAEDASIRILWWEE